MYFKCGEITLLLVLFLLSCHCLLLDVHHHSIQCVSYYICISLSIIVFLQGISCIFSPSCTCIYFSRCLLMLRIGLMSASIIIYLRLLVLVR
jgi:hypothetical protein